MTAEKSYRAAPGWFALFFFLALLISGPALVLFRSATGPPSPWLIGGAIFSSLVAIIGMIGFLAIPPNQARVLLLFGDYRGTVTQSGSFWVNPFFSKKKLSLRVRNFETGSTSMPETKDAAGRDGACQCDDWEPDAREPHGRVRARPETGDRCGC